MNSNTDINKIASAFNLLYDGVVIINSCNSIVFANTACERIFGYSPSSLIGQPLNILIPAKFHDAHQKDLNAFKANPTPRLMGERSVLYGMDAKGERVPVTISIAKFSDDEDFFIAVIRDGSLINTQFEREKIRAETDALTQLGNRNYFTQVFPDLVKKTAQPFALLFIDLNKFKPVNDDYGHETGDITLQIVAKRLKAVLRSDDVVVRIGGDEFAVVLRSISDKNSIIPIIRKIIHSVSRPIHIKKHIISIGASIGCSLFPVDGNNEKDLLNKADSAMYHAKTHGTGFSFYDETISKD